jgi:uncharacterized protein DUF4142
LVSIFGGKKTKHSVAAGIVKRRRGNVIHLARGNIAEFEKEANSGRDPDVKAWASKTLPTLRAHLDGAKALLDSSTSR